MPGRAIYPRTSIYRENFKLMKGMACSYISETIHNIHIVLSSPDFSLAIEGNANTFLGNLSIVLVGFLRYGMLICLAFGCCYDSFFLVGWWG